MGLVEITGGKANLGIGCGLEENLGFVDQENTARTEAYLLTVLYFW